MDHTERDDEKVEDVRYEEEEEVLSEEVEVEVEAP